MKNLRFDARIGAVNVRRGAPYGLTAVYDKSVTIEAVEASIDEHYAKWAYDATPNGKLWRIESEKFVIQLASLKDGPQLIYLPLVNKPLPYHHPK